MDWKVENEKKMIDTKLIKKWWWWGSVVRCSFPMFKENENNRKHMRTRQLEERTNYERYVNGPHWPVNNRGLAYINKCKILWNKSTTNIIKCIKDK